MKRVLFLFPLALICSFVLFSCALDKKSRLTNNGVIVKIEPSVVDNVPIGSSVTLTAIIRNAKNQHLDLPVSWSVSPALGEFSPADGKTVAFTAQGNGIAVITAVCSGITGSINVGCGTAVAPDTIIISSAPTGLVNGSYAVLTASLYSGAIPVPVDGSEITWRVSGPGTISAANGNSVTFTANAAPAFGQASVKVSFGNLSAAANIFVADAAFPSKDARMILNDKYLDPGVNEQFQIWGDWNWYQSSFDDPNKTPQPPATSNLVINTVSGQGITIDPQDAMKLEYTAGTLVPNPYSGVTLNFKSPVSGFAYLTFYAKGVTGSNVIIVQCKNGTYTVSEQAFNVSAGSWGEAHSLNISGHTITAVNFMFRRSSDGSVPGTVLLDFIYFDNELPRKL